MFRIRQDALQRAGLASVSGLLLKSPIPPPHGTQRQTFMMVLTVALVLVHVMALMKVLVMLPCSTQTSLEFGQDVSLHVSSECHLHLHPKADLLMQQAPHCESLNARKL